MATIPKTQKEKDLLKFIKDTRLSYVKQWTSEVKKYEKHLLIETNPYAIKLKKDEIKRLKTLIKTYK